MTLLKLDAKVVTDIWEIKIQNKISVLKKKITNTQML